MPSPPTPLPKLGEGLGVRAFLPLVPGPSTSARRTEQRVGHAASADAADPVGGAAVLAVATRHADAVAALRNARARIVDVLAARDHARAAFRVGVVAGQHAGVDGVTTGFVVGAADAAAAAIAFVAAQLATYALGRAVAATARPVPLSQSPEQQSASAPHAKPSARQGEPQSRVSGSQTPTQQSSSDAQAAPVTTQPPQVCVYGSQSFAQQSASEAQAAPPRPHVPQRSQPGSQTPAGALVVGTAGRAVVAQTGGAACVATKPGCAVGVVNAARARHASGLADLAAPAMRTADLTAAAIFVCHTTGRRRARGNCPRRTPCRDSRRSAGPARSRRASPGSRDACERQPQPAHRQHA